MLSHRLFASPRNSSLSLNTPEKSPAGNNIRTNLISPMVSSPEKQRNKNKKSSDGSLTAIPQTHCANLGVNLSNSAIIESDSDSMTDSEFFSKSNQKLPYSLQEDEMIIKFVLKGQNIYKTGSISLWKHLEYTTVHPKRTYQSLKNRFLRNIKPFFFSTYRHMIKDEETAKKILSKYPELKKSFGKTNVLPDINLPKRISTPNKVLNPLEISEPAAENVSISSEKQDRLRDIISSNALNIARPSSSIFGEKTHKRNIELTKNSIRVTFNRNVYAPEKRPIESTGVYQKFFKLKSRNVLVHCPHCGRSGDEIDKAEESESEDLIIPNSVQSSTSSTSENKSPKKSVKNNEESNSPTVKTNKNKRKHNSKSSKTQSTSRSPSLLEEVSDQDLSSNTGTPKRKKTGKGSEKNVSFTQPSESQSQNSEELLSDKDLDSLYRETIANCRLFIDSDADEEAEITTEEKRKNEEEERNSVKKKLRSFGFQAKISEEKANAENFFVNSDPPFSVTSSEKSSSKSPKKPALNNKSPLARNMQRMLRSSSKRK